MAPFVRALFVVCLLLSSSAMAQNRRPGIIPPLPQALNQADVMVDTVFTALKEGRTQDVADWLGKHMFYASDAATRVQQINNYKSQLDIMLISPPAGVHGPVDDYDLLEESTLPGTSRYFRRTYMVYHTGAPLIWEFRFYVRPDGTVSLNAFQFSPNNPFEYLSTPDMLLNNWTDG